MRKKVSGFFGSNASPLIIIAMLIGTGIYTLMVDVAKVRNFEGRSTVHVDKKPFPASPRIYFITEEGQSIRIPCNKPSNCYSNGAIVRYDTRDPANKYFVDTPSIAVQGLIFLISGLMALGIFIALKNGTGKIRNDSRYEPLGS